MNQSNKRDIFQSALWLMIGLAFIGLIYILNPILTPFIVGAVLAYMGDPLVNWFCRHRFSRTWAALIVILLSGLAILLLLLIFVPMIVKEISEIIEKLPKISEIFSIIKLKIGAYIPFSHKLPKTNTEILRQWFEAQGGSINDVLSTVLTQAKSSGSLLIASITQIVLIPIVMFYLLVEWPKLIKHIRLLIPRPALRRTTKIVLEINKVISHFLSGQLLVMVILGCYYSIALYIGKLDYALPIGILTGIFAFIPYVGFGTGLVTAILIAILQNQGFSPMITVAIVYSIGQLLESYVLIPYIIGERIGLHPLLVIFALLAFGQLFGFVGLLIALPASAALLVGLKEMRYEWLKSRLYRGKIRPNSAQAIPPKEL